MDLSKITFVSMARKSLSIQELQINRLNNHFVFGVFFYYFISCSKACIKRWRSASASVNSRHSEIEAQLLLDSTVHCFTCSRKCRIIVCSRKLVQVCLKSLSDEQNYQRVSIGGRKKKAMDLISSRLSRLNAIDRRVTLKVLMWSLSSLYRRTRTTWRHVRFDVISKCT